MSFKGVMTALVTPLDEKGAVVEESLRKLIRFQIKNGVHSVLVLGGTGEYVQLSMAERKRAIDITISEASGKIPVVVGAGSPGLSDNIEIGQYAKKAGADAVMLVSPYYVIPSQEGIIDYHKKFDNAVKLPLILYNIPYRTNVNMLPETIEAMVKEIPNIVAIKECSPNLAQVIELILRVGDKIEVLCGDEFLASTELMLGAKGLIMASANLIPDVWVKMYNLMQEKEFEAVIKMTKDYYPLFKAVFMETNPGPLKEAMRMAGLPADNISSPLRIPTDATKIALKAVMKELKLI